MEVSEILKRVFDRQFKFKTDEDSNKKTKYLESVNKWVVGTLDANVPYSGILPDQRPGRLGPANVKFDVGAHFGLFIIGSERLSVHSQSNFSTILSNTCVFQGKWQYEVQLGTKGVMQIGWATRGCRFSQETGVGDTVDSYAYDGNRVRKWNNFAQKYGQAWLSGDVIGCCGDFTSGKLEFFRNGVSMGEAFSSVPLGPGRAYFPAVSLGFGEHLVANFGNLPFRYPVEGYEPLQIRPSAAVARCELILGWFSDFLDVQEQISQARTTSNDIEVSLDCFLLSISKIIVHSFAPLMTQAYLTEECIIPYIQRIVSRESHTNPKSSKGKSTVTLIQTRNKLCNWLDLLWTFLEERELKPFLENICAQLLSRFRHVPSTLEYVDQRRSLTLLQSICEHTRSRQLLLNQIFFDTVKLVEFLHVKMLDEPGLINIIDQSWWNCNGMNKEIEERKKPYMKSCMKIYEAVSGVEALQVELLKTLMINTDGSNRQPSSRKIFLKRLRIFFHDNYMSTRTIPLMQTPLPVTLCCFHRLLSTFRQLWEYEVGKRPVTIDSKIFYDASVNYYTIDRIGGVLSHLNKTYVQELTNVLGPDHKVVNKKLVQENPSTDGQFLPGFLGGPSIAIRVPQDLQGNNASGLPNVVPVLARLLQQANSGPSSGPFGFDGSLGVLRPDKSRVSNGFVDSTQSLMELLDGIVLFYHTSAHKQIVKVSTMRDNMEDYITAYESARTRLETFKNPKGSAKRESTVNIQFEIERSRQVFEAKLLEQSRFMAWVRAAIFSEEKQKQLSWLLNVLVATVKASVSEGVLFSFLPEFYLDSMFEISTALRSLFHPTCSYENIDGFNNMLLQLSEFLCLHFADPRIVNASSKDTVVQALAGFVANPLTLQALEKVPFEAQRNMVKGLLRPYENRAWAQSNWILVRFWQGCGFAFRYEKSPHLTRKVGPRFLQSDSAIINQHIKPLPSKIFQNHVKDIILNNEPLTTTFLNSMLNQLNWAFSEFIGMLQEIQNISSRPERVFIESRQLKICATCFDLSLALLRVLEMVSNLCVGVFTDLNRPNSELLLSRLYQLICQILNRVSSTTGCFQHVVLLEIPDLEGVDHFPILAAVVGILLALFKEDLKNFRESAPVSNVAHVLLTEPSFQLCSLTFLLGDIKQQYDGSKSKIAYSKTKGFSFNNYQGDVSDEELKDVRRLINMLEVGQRKVSAMSLHSDDDVCTICYAYPVSVMFLPCRHQSCKVCIAHHLLNGRECFFCKAVIEKVVDVDGTVLHDLGRANDT
ncbi:UNVERIFIED_CONTAM: hypothetical protein PYX00_000425 [Menopon gallinae]|uniref:RING-type E3 ubiquitin transferase n=1 Tax=Menopon gallinae TaxID=328185 RepID=A0AAW2IAI2_9NEOP